MEYRFLADIEFQDLHKTFLEAFSDYIITLRPSEEQLREMLTRRGADYSLSVGAFERSNFFGFNLNALDTFSGMLTVYDVATGVIPSQRRKGIAKALFDFSLPALRNTKAKQYLLEVIDSNQAAIAAYKSVGFKVSREFESFQRKSNAIQSRPCAVTVQIQPTKIDWGIAQTFWDWLPSWQNSIRSMERSRGEKIVLGAFLDNHLAAYAIGYPSTGDIPQFAVDSSYRRMGIASSLLNALQRYMPETVAARAINIDASAKPTLQFLRYIGFENFLGQYEMKLDL